MVPVTHLAPCTLLNVVIKITDIFPLVLGRAGPRSSHKPAEELGLHSEGTEGPSKGLSQVGTGCNGDGNSKQPLRGAACRAD